MSKIAGNTLRSAVAEMSNLEGRLASLKEIASDESMDGRDQSDGTTARAVAAGLADMKGEIDKVVELITSNIIEDGPVSKPPDEV